MAKSIQDLLIFQNQLAEELKLDSISIEIHCNKSFQVWHGNNGEAQCLYNSEEYEIDINDFPYSDVEEIAKQIIQEISEQALPVAAFEIGNSKSSLTNFEDL